MQASPHVAHPKQRLFCFFYFIFRTITRKVSKTDIFIIHDLEKEIDNVNKTIYMTKWTFRSIWFKAFYRYSFAAASFENFAVDD